VRTQRPHDISTGVWTQRPTHFPLKATKYILETTQLFRESDTFLPLFRLTTVIPDNKAGPALRLFISVGQYIFDLSFYVDAPHIP